MKRTKENKKQEVVNLACFMENVIVMCERMPDGDTGVLRCNLKLLSGDFRIDLVAQRMNNGRRLVDIFGKGV